MNGQYEVLNPWADVDPVPPRGISPRLQTLNGKRIGLFFNGKVAARPMLPAVEEELKQRFTGITFSTFRRGVNLDVAHTADKDNYEKWVREQDAIVLAVGD